MNEWMNEWITELAINDDDDDDDDDDKSVIANDEYMCMCMATFFFLARCAL